MTTSTTTPHEVMQRHHKNTAAQKHQDNDPYQDRYAERDNEVFVQGGPSLFAKLKDIVSVSEILRLFGAVAVFASMSLFLMNGWTEGNDIQRYLKLLTQTGLLTIGGFIMSFALKENKGARLFFALALMSVVANFTILGALTYSLFQLDGNLIDYPSMVTWTVVSAGSFWPVFIGAFIALAVLTRFSFSIFARKIAMPLSASFLVLNTLIMIPVRSSLFVSIIALLAFAFACLVVKKLSDNEKVVFTNETKFALSLLFAPALLIIARAVSLYSIDEVLLVLLSGMVYTILRFLAQRMQEVSILGVLNRVVMFTTSIVFSYSLVSLLPEAIESLQPLIFSLIIVGMSFDRVKFSKSASVRQNTLTITTALLVGINVFLAVVGNDVVIQLGSALVCGGLFYLAGRLASSEQQNKLSKIFALLGTITSVIVLFIHFVDIINMGNWMLIGLLGATLIVLGSLYERFGLNLTALFSSENQIKEV